MYYLKCALIVFAGSILGIALKSHVKKTTTASPATAATDLTGLGTPKTNG